jgi:catechol 2,3-dioxygenase-like lactoylglutathione lyase family enzyme
MLRNVDHISFVVTDIDKAKAFFALLGFAEAITAVATGENFSRYMDIPDGEADHVTLVMAKSSPRFEVQLLKFHHPDAIANPHVRDLYTVGFNHLCFSVDDIEAEVTRLKAHGVTFRNDIWEYQDRKITLMEGPDGITVELAQWN